MFSKKILCGVVAYTTLSSGSVGSYAAGGVEYENIPSVIVDNPLPIAGALTAVTFAILTYKILAKSYGKEIPLENSKDEKVKKNLHEDLPGFEKTAKVEDPEKGSGEIKEEPVNVSKENENNLDGFNLDFLKNNIESWYVYLGIGVLSTAVIIYLVYKHYKEAPYKKAFEKLKEIWDFCCENLKNAHVKIGNEEFNGRTVFRALVDLRKDEQGNPVFVFGKKKIELKLSGGKIIEIDKNIYTNKEEQKTYNFNLADIEFYIWYVTRLKEEFNALIKKDNKKGDNVMNIENDEGEDIIKIKNKNDDEENLIEEDYKNNKNFGYNANFEDRELLELIQGVDEYDYGAFQIKDEDTPAQAFNKIVGLWEKLYKNLEGIKVPFYKNFLDGKKVFRVRVDLRKDEQGNQLFVFGSGVLDFEELKLKDGIVLEKDKKGNTNDSSLEKIKKVFEKILEISNEILDCPNKNDFTYLPMLLAHLEDYDRKNKAEQKMLPELNSGINNAIPGVAFI